MEPEVTRVMIGLLATAVTSLVLVGIFARRFDDPREVAAWARAYGVELTARNGPMVSYFIRLVILLRVVGGVAGTVLGTLFDDATGLGTSSGYGFWVWVLVGWLAGTAWAERALIRPGDRAAASLTPRRTADYLSPTLRVAPFAAAALTVAVVLAGVVATPPVGPTAWPSDRKLVAAAVVAIVLALVVGGLRWAIVARRQPVAHPDVVAADDAVRANVLHHVGGAGTAAILLVTAGVGQALLEPAHLPYGLRGWLPAIPLVGAVVAWRWVAHRPWRVRRGAARAPVSAPAPAP